MTRKISIALGAGGLALALAAAVPNPYGACAHVTRGEPPDRTCEMLHAAGIGWVRSDFDWSGLERRPGEWRFDGMDRVISACEARGVQLLPILGYTVPWAKHPHEHLDQWGAYVRQVVRHYGSRLPVLEVWNEENIPHFWSKPNPTNYLAVLRRTYEVVKAEAPELKVAFGGTAGVPFGFIEEVYKLGGAKYFDIICIHPYSHPWRPEGHVDTQIEKLRGIMAKYGDGTKPMWITEVGWPTHQVALKCGEVLRAALKTAQPDRKNWRALYLPARNEEDMPVSLIQRELPAGSHLEVCSPDELAARLARGDVDVVIYPFSEDYAVETVEPVREFVKRGGLLVDFGGMPMWNPTQLDADGCFVPAQRESWKDRKRLRISENAWWIDKRYPEKALVKPSAAAAALFPKGYQIEGERFLDTRALQPGDQLIPLLSVQTNGIEAVCAGVYKFNSDFKGAIALCGVFNRIAATSDEARQAKMMARVLGISFAENIERFFWYETTQPDVNPFDPESYFGMLRANFAPKPAYSAYMTFIDRRPCGSTSLPCQWRSDDGRDYYPQWKLPDGRVAGMIWTVGRKGKRPLRFTGKDKDRDIEFMDHLGARVRPERQGDAWMVEVGDAPVYFRGGKLDVGNR